MIIDLCSGIGRFNNKDVISVDMDPKTKPDIVADIRYLPFKPGMEVDFVHASPPCTYFSKARRWSIGWHPEGIAQSLELIAACYRAFAYLGAKRCSLENPQAIEQILGKRVKFKYDKHDHKNCTTNFYLNPRSLKRSIIPQDVRQQILMIDDTSR